MSTKLRGVIVLAVLGVALATMGLLWKRRPLPSSIVDVEPLDRDRALVVRRDERGRPDSRGDYVELVDGPSGRRLWQDQLPRAGRVFNAVNIADVDSLPSSVVLPSGTAVMLLEDFAAAGESPRDRQHLVGFAMADGRISWRVDLHGQSDVSVRLLPLADAVVVVTFHASPSSREEGRAEVAVLEGASGRARWKVPIDLGPVPFPVWLRGGTLVLSPAGRVILLDLATGATRASVKVFGEPCVMDTSVWFMGAGDGAPVARELWELPLAEAKPRQLSTLAEVVVPEGLCGRRGQSVWMLEKGFTGTDTLPATPAHLLRFDVATGALQKRLDLGEHRGGIDSFRRGRQVPETWPLSGESTRFVPLLEPQLASTGALVMVDLDQGRVAWSSARSEKLLASVVRDGSRHYFVGRINDGARPGTMLVAALDGESGKLLAAARVPAESGAGPRFAAGRVWISRGAELAVLDGASMKPIGATGSLRIEDARAEAEALLAAESPR